MLNRRERLTLAVAASVVAGAVAFDGGAIAGDAVRGWEAGTAKVQQGQPAPQLIPVYEEDGPGEKLIGQYTVDQLNVVCGYGLGDDYQVVTVVATGRMGYALVSDERCKP
jgi:hypothetical protein